MGYTRAELESYRDATRPDLVETGVRLRNAHGTVDPLACADTQPAHAARIIA
ncbi:hypothetical protein [Microbacterium sp. Leaf179]|uniref:hypothetical protein n=1 Tax=Microbacterium sp. Leaf179 TaxID=1736288 RepID=UPI000AB43A6D|nr:hypothetical protein [Microbacterium sp. Leaf179]